MMRLASAVFIVLLVGCQLKSEEGKKVHNTGAKVHCVGRHLINIPTSFIESSITTGILKAEGASAQDPEIDIVVQSGIASKAKFDLAVQQRRGELSGSESKTVNVLQLDKVLADGGALFRVQEIDDAYFSEIFFLRGTTMVKMRLESYDNSYLKAEEQMIKLSADIVERVPNQIAEKSGFCLGPLVVNSNLSQEVANFTFRDTEGLVLEVDIDTFSRDDSTSLLSRMSRDSSILRDLKIRTEVLRAREREVVGMFADEWLGIGYLSNDHNERSLKFMLETKRKSPSRIAPSITLSLDSGQPLKDGTPTTTKLGNNEAVQLWDHIVDSIRIAVATES